MIGNIALPNARFWIGWLWNEYMSNNMIMYYSDSDVTWASWSLKLPANKPIVQYMVAINNMKTSKRWTIGPFVVGNCRLLVDSHTKGH